MTHFEFVIDFLFPRRCSLCHDLIDGKAILCAPCWSELRFIEGSMCGQCGRPFEVGMPQGSLCGGCLDSPPLWDCGRSALIYERDVATLVSDFKFRDRLDIVPTLGRWMLRAGRDLINEADYIVPAPLHWTRRISRYYNQSSELAKAILKARQKAEAEQNTEENSGPELLLDVLLKIKYRPQQMRLSRSRRLTSPKGTLLCNPKRKAQISGTRVLVIDDVMTTGATLRECTRVLQTAGVEHVTVLTLARVL